MSLGSMGEIQGADRNYGVGALLRSAGGWGVMHQVRRRASIANSPRAHTRGAPVSR